MTDWWHKSPRPVESAAPGVDWDATFPDGITPGGPDESSPAPATYPNLPSPYASRQAREEDELIDLRARVAKLEQQVADMRKAMPS
jgi:hypothetical protein